MKQQILSVNDSHVADTQVTELDMSSSGGNSRVRNQHATVEEEQRRIPPPRDAREKARHVEGKNRGKLAVNRMFAKVESLEKLKLRIAYVHLRT